MEATWAYFLYSLLFCFLISKLLSLTKTWRKNLPPSPLSLPIIGHLHLLKEPIHRTLQKLSDQHGPIFSLSFGSRKVLVVSSPFYLEECFTKNDINFANRPHFIINEYLSYNFTTISAAPYGNLWRNLRRLASVELFSTRKLQSFQNIRQQEIMFLLKDLFNVSGRNFAKVELKSKLSEFSFNVIMRMTTGKRYFGLEVEDVDKAKRFCQMTREIFNLSGTANLGDFVPFLRLIDYGGVEKKMMKVCGELDEAMQGLIDQHKAKLRMDSSSRGHETQTMVESILILQESEPELYSDEIIKSLISQMLTAGTDTSSVTIEWAMSLLLNHPAVLKKAQEELDLHVGRDRLVDESDYPKLTYLQSIINETFRLYPAAPLLVAHESSDDCIIGGYDVPRGTMLFVNAWALHRDPKVWEDPTSFRPERYEGVEIEPYKLIPFGLGRRTCPGAGLANRVVSWTLAALIQCFEWERIGQKKVDMSEGSGLTMPKAKPLEAMCKAREVMFDVLKQL